MLVVARDGLDPTGARRGTRETGGPRFGEQCHRRR
jgi:hypothetical protein